VFHHRFYLSNFARCFNFADDIIDGIKGRGQDAPGLDRTRLVPSIADGCGVRCPGRIRKPWEDAVRATPDFDFGLPETADDPRKRRARRREDRAAGGEDRCEDWFARELWPAMGELACTASPWKRNGAAWASAISIT
jgi:hypothetical protein